jgi:hypothetical protein
MLFLHGYVNYFVVQTTYWSSSSREPCWLKLTRNSKYAYLSQPLHCPQIDSNSKTNQLVHQVDMFVHEVRGKPGVGLVQGCGSSNNELMGGEGMGAYEGPSNEAGVPSLSSEGVSPFRRWRAYCGRWWCCCQQDKRWWAQTRAGCKSGTLRY